MIDRSKIVRIFRNEYDKLICITCDGIVNRQDQKRCPTFLGENSFCLCKYSSDGLILYNLKKGNLFNNTTDKIISTIYNCNSNINKCHVENCDNCNLKTVIDKCRGTQ